MTTAVYFHPYNELHEMGENHPESPARMRAMFKAFKDFGLDDVVQYRLSPEADEQDIRRVHIQDMINLVKDIPDPGFYNYVDETPLNQYSWKASLRTVGAAVAATNAIIDGEIDNAFCVNRPIGHHSEMGEAMGFCVFNSMAAAAMYAVRKRGLNKVVIVDLDVHHGNGTENIFAYEPKVAMASYYQEYIYPYRGNEFPIKHMLNVPVPDGADGTLIRKIVTEQWLPFFDEQKPEMIFISSGFDAHRDDPLAGMQLVEEDYAWITRQLMDYADKHCQGRVLSVSEGGYSIDALYRSVAAHVRVLAGLD